MRIALDYDQRYLRKLLPQMLRNGTGTCAQLDKMLRVARVPAQCLGQECRRWRDSSHRAGGFQVTEEEFGAQNQTFIVFVMERIKRVRARVVSVPIRAINKFAIPERLCGHCMERQ